MQVDLFAHPARLAAQVGVVRPALYAGSDQCVAIELVGPDRAEDDLGSRAHGVEAGGIVSVGHDQRRARRCADFVADHFELVHAAPCHRPFRGIGGIAIFAHEMLGDETPGVPGGAIDDDVEFGVGHVSLLCRLNARGGQESQRRYGVRGMRGRTPDWLEMASKRPSSAKCRALP